MKQSTPKAGLNSCQKEKKKKKKEEKLKESSRMLTTRQNEKTVLHSSVYNFFTVRP